MKKNNMMNKPAYIYLNIGCAILFTILYGIFFYRNLGGMNTFPSVMILLLIEALIVTGGTILTSDGYRCPQGVLVNTIAPLGIYTWISYLGLRPILSIVGGVLIVVVGIVEALYIIFRNIEDDKNRNEILVTRFRTFWRLYRLCATAMLLILSIVLFVVSASIKSEKMDALEKATVKADARTDFEMNIDTLTQLDEEVYKKLTLEQRIDVIQTVINVETEYLGLKKAPTVYFGTLSQSYIACYNKEDNYIFVDKSSLENYDAYTMLGIVCHECYHAYEYRLIEVYNGTRPSLRTMAIFYHVDAYKKEFKDYVETTDQRFEHGSENYELDANEYAQERANYYLARLAYYEETKDKALQVVPAKYYEETLREENWMDATN